VANNEVLVSSTAKPFEQTITAGTHRFTSDEPLGVGGGDAGADPYTLLLAALGACTSMTLMVYARRKKWPLEHVDVRLSHAREHAEDCAECEGGKRRIESIERRIALTGALSDEQKSRLLAMADKCPIHMTLTAKLEIRTTLAD
jgi:putative redox protein